MFSQDLRGSNKPALSESATVVDERKLHGEIFIRADGKKVIRRAICLIGTEASTAAGDIATPVISSSTPHTGEIFRNTDGKMVRRFKRAIIKNAAALNGTTPNEKACDVGEYILSTAANGTGRMPLPHSVNPREKLQITPCVTPQAAPQQHQNEITPLITTPVATLTPTNGCFTINVCLIKKVVDLVVMVVGVVLYRVASYMHLLISFGATTFIYYGFNN